MVWRLSLYEKTFSPPPKKTVKKNEFIRLYIIKLLVEVFSWIQLYHLYRNIEDPPNRLCASLLRVRLVIADEQRLLLQLCVHSAIVDDYPNFSLDDLCASVLKISASAAPRSQWSDFLLTIAFFFSNCKFDCKPWQEIPTKCIDNNVIRSSFYSLTVFFF